MRFRLNLEALWELKRTVELGSMTKAAAELGLSQPALTRRIMQFERELCVSVLVRDHAGVKPTEMGALILERAQPLFDEVTELQEEIAAASGQMKGEIAICLPTAMHQMVTRPFLKAASEKLPMIRLRLIDAFDAVLHDQLVSKKADMGIFIHESDLKVPGLHLEPIANDQLCLLGRSPLLGTMNLLKISDLAAVRLVLPGPNNGLRRKIDAAFRRAKIAPPLIEVDSYRTITDIVDSGDAYSISPSCGITDADNRLWWSPIARLSITWTFAVQESKMQSIVVRAVGDLLKQQVAQWANGSTWAHNIAQPAKAS